MKTSLLASIITATLMLAACGRKSATAASPDTTSAPAPANAATRSPAVAAPALSVWTLGNKSGAIDDFLAADWTATPVFPVDSALSLTEAQFKALSDADRAKDAGDMSSTLNALRELVKAVLQEGRDAAAKGDADRASKCFTAVKVCGTALDKQENLVALIRLGQSIQRDADRELKGR